MKSINEEWDEVRGLNTGAKPVEREEWMLTLPEGRRQDALQFFRGGKTSFSKSGAQGNVDQSWTAGGSTSAKKQERDLTAEAKDQAERRKRAKVQEAMNEYNEKNRPKSLTEMHLEGAYNKSSAKKKKKKKKKKKTSKKDKKKKKKKRKRNAGVTDARVSSLKVGGFSRDAGGGAFAISQESKAQIFKDASQLSTRFSSGA